MKPYRQAQLEVMLRKMKAASDGFYSYAVSIGCHPFIEFTGLMNEYIKLCWDAFHDGDDFTLMSAHSEKPLPMKPYHAHYLGEKFDCIFGAGLRSDGDNMQAFERQLRPDEGPAVVAVEEEKVILATENERFELTREDAIRIGESLLRGVKIINVVLDLKRKDDGLRKSPG